NKGQQWTISLSVKLAEIQLLHELTQEYPIILLDDVMSELDHRRQSSLLNYIHGKTQTFITTTDLEGISWEIVKEPKIYHISAGTISTKEIEMAEDKSKAALNKAKDFDKRADTYNASQIQV